ncbi:hypothetical protein QEJ31_12180 [Pigmentibacter sp. JX0631]|uniref:hypothetical protein n=1 Tax=Pigmentibacter sp. JX0631 TaxID=2976982 RepID=UPI002469AC08|nr:hypothetical protein [Pigmentibacter sp. JX0631]WGL59280.1 hypothetical protein QEJ31_12180 [Pigmentibacter sp. JX0631]
MTKWILKSLTIVTSAVYITSSYGMIDILGSAGYSNYPDFGGSSFNGWNAGAKALITDSPSTIDWVFGGGFRYESVKSSTSDYIASSSSTISTFQLGGDIGFKIMPINALSLYALASLYIGVYNSYSASITIGNTSGTVNPAVNSNWNIGVGGIGMYNVTPEFGVGAGIYVARGIMDYSESTFNNYKVKGSSGGYNIMNYNLVVSYSL